MQERGVSRIVSVKFHRDQEAPESEKKKSGKASDSEKDAAEKEATEPTEPAESK